MGFCFEGGLQRYYNGFIRIPNQGPGLILRDHRIYLRPMLERVCVLLYGKSAGKEDSSREIRT